MTEDEAKTKWCSMVRNENGRNISELKMPKWSRCIVSDCMLWRRDEKVRTERPIQNDRPKGEGWKDTGETAELFKASPKPTDDCLQRVKIWERSFPEERNGHCGLAGKE